MIIFLVLPILFAILCDNSNEFKKIWQTSNLSFKKILIKFLIALTAINRCVLIFHLKNFISEKKILCHLFFFQYDKRFVLENPNERENILALSKIIPGQ